MGSRCGASPSSATRAGRRCGHNFPYRPARSPDLDHQVSWMGFLFSVPALFEYLLREGRGYDAIVFSPYLFWTTSVCAPLVAERAVVIPCLHDETYARLDVLRPVLADPALVWFLSGPEHDAGPPARSRRAPAQRDRCRRAGAFPLRRRGFQEAAWAGAPVRAPRRPAGGGQGPRMAARGLLRHRPGRGPRPRPRQHRERRARSRTCGSRGSWPTGSSTSGL